MKLLIVISRTDAESVWNAFRLGNFSVDQGDKVKIFLMGQGVEYQKSSNDKFDIVEQTKKFLVSENANILACGTCMKARAMESAETCPISTLNDLYETVKESDKILTF